MARILNKKLTPLLCIALLGLGLPVSAQDGMEDAVLVNDEDGGGVTAVQGDINFSDPTISTYGAEPLVFLGNMNAMFTGEFEFSTEYLDPTDSQVLGRILSDVGEPPVSYEVLLPIDPGANLYDVDNDGEEDAGISLFSTNFTFNVVGDPYVDNRELIFYRSYNMSLDYETLYDVIGYKVLVWAPDDQQGFPSGFGDDGKLFTEDDPIVRIPAGWTVVDLDTAPFTFDRSHVANVDIIESTGEEVPDFSAQNYSEAFDSLIELMRDRYAFTEFHQVDWDALKAEYAPLFAAAEEADDTIAYQLALQEFTENAIADGHIGINSAPYLNTLPVPSEDIAGGLGIAIRELSDGRVIVNFLGEGTPAAEAGIEMRAEVLEINGLPVDEAISAEQGLNPPYGSPVLKRLDQLRDVMRFAVGEDVEITYQNPGAAEPVTVTLTTVQEDESRIFSRTAVYGNPTGSNLPVEYDILPNGYGYISIFSFSDDNRLTLMLWERAMATMNGFGVPGIIIDMRYNNGGSPDISNPMLGYFFDEPTYTGTSAQYFPDLDTFEFDELYDQVIEPADEDLRYHGEIAVLVSPACASNCEFFSYTLGLLDNTTIIGQYPSGGYGGGVDYVFLPDDVVMQYTVGRAVGADNEIHIETTGVEPELVVPVTEENLFTDADVVLDAAIAFLDEATATAVEDRGEIALGESIEGELVLNSRARYTFTAAENTTIDISVSDETNQFDTVLRIYNATDTVIAENDDADGPNGVYNSRVEGLDIAAGETIIIEAGTYDDAGEGSFTLTVEESAE